MASERIQDSGFRIRNQGLRTLLCVDSHDVRRSVNWLSHVSASSLLLYPIFLISNSYLALCLDLPDVDASLCSPIGRNTWTGSR